MIISVNSTQLFVDIKGIGKPLILLHGNGEDHRIFNDLVEKLKLHFTCYLVDSRNHGKSMITDHYHYDIMANDIYELISKLNLVNPYFLGFSDGGIIGTMIAVKYPNIFQSMAILGTNIHKKGIIKKERESIKKIYEDTFNPLYKMMLDEPNLKFKQLDKIKFPVLIVVGEYDMISFKHTKAIKNHLVNSRLVVLEKKHHDDYIVHRDDLYDVLIDYWVKL